MARTSRRALDSTAFDLFETLSGPFERFTRSTFEFLSRAQGPVDDIPPLFPLSNGFTDKNDVVLFDSVKPGTFTTPYYHALNGNDYVYLPSTKAKADAIGYDPGQVFNGDGGNDYIVGQGLNDLINGGRHNDYVAGGAGADVLFGDTGDDKVLGGDGNDILAGGFGYDFTDGGDGDDIIYNIEQDDIAYSGHSDHVEGGAGNDDIAATADDYVSGGDGDDVIWLVDDKGTGHGAAHGDDGNDVIVGSAADDWLWTGMDWLTWFPEHWSLVNKFEHGGFHDQLDGGDGNDHVTTMMYCTADVTTGNGDDSVFVTGDWDNVATGADDDTVWLFGGAGAIDLGEGDDTFRMCYPAYNFTKMSQITLGEGADQVAFATDEWLEYENEQPLYKAPLILDFDPNEDVIAEFLLTNLTFSDPALNLNSNYVKTIDIAGGASIVYDDPNGTASDFVFANFSGVTANELQININQNAVFW